MQLLRTAIQTENGFSAAGEVRSAERMGRIRVFIATKENKLLDVLENILTQTRKRVQANAVIDFDY